MKSRGKQILWTLISVLLAFLSVWAVVSQSQEMSLTDLWAAIEGCDPLWILLAVVSMSGYIFFEGLALWFVLKQSGCPCRIRQGIVFASADIYCASITPSATGGQPACAWFMVRDGISMGYVTAVLTLNLIAHTFATLICGMAAVLLNPASFLGIPLLARFLVVIGYITVTGLAVLFICLLGMAEKIRRIGYRIVDWLARKSWVKRPGYWKERITVTLSEYSACVKVVRGKWSALLILLLLNLLQRIAQTLAAPLVYLSQGGDKAHIADVFSAQIYSAIGSMCMPVPGGMGIADYLLFCGLNSFMDKESALQLELLSRSCSFYLCVLLSLVIVLLGYIRRRRLYFIRRH